MDYNIKRITPLKNKFVRITQNNYYTDLIENTFKKSLTGTKYHKYINIIIEQLRKLILSPNNNSSLRDIFIAIQMKESKTFITTKDFIHMEDPRPINTKVFKTNKKTLEKIRQHIKQIKKDIYYKQKEINYLLFIKDMVNPQNIITQNVKEALYKKTVNKKTNIEHRLYNLTVLLLKEYSRKFKEITLKPVPIITKDNHKTVERVFPMDIEKSFVEIMKIYRLINDMLTNDIVERKIILRYSLADFKEYIKNKPYPNTFFDLLEKLSNIFYKVSKRLTENYLTEEKIQSMTREQRIKIISRYNFPEQSIPYPNKKIKLNCPLINKTVKEVYTKLICFSTNFSYFYQNKKLIEKLSSVEKLKKSLHPLKVNLKRIM